ncbi:DUF4422 domain-containing protein [Eubacterium oxidoreducens]|uniref:DUF4422 domain-containing protein n=1 Tax=Eubacterium oxidoreducens TaxID=1732 RepID=A0A1G6BS39_EUBOX|nr:DUF4422 domain-containing protein [Eubacterium oxidoreducens]SDB23469.1 protein of unknown function [Eubacterium oxidoreducens]
MATTFFVMTHKKFQPPANEAYIPLHVGRALGDDLGYLGDNTGTDQISAENPYFGELTGLYWIWKNYEGQENIATNHYRRFFYDEDGHLMTSAKADELLKTHNIIVSKKATIPQTYREYYAEAHNLRDLEAIGRSIEKIYPGYYPFFEEVLSGHIVYSGNLMIMPRKLYDEYCTWLFTILFDASSEIDVSGYDLYHARVYGFLSEELLLVWAHAKELSVYEATVGFTEEKAETQELKLAVAELLKQGHVKDAQELFNNIMAIRPDLSLPASDFHGEIEKLQPILYIMNLEKENHMSGFLDVSHELPQLFEHYDTTYKILQHISTRSESDEDLTYLATHFFSPAALEVYLAYDPYQQFHSKPLDEPYMREWWQQMSS